MSTVTGGPRPFIMIGTQAWSTKNLSVNTYRNGDVIPEVTDETQWANLTTGAWCYNNYNNNGTDNGKIYGKMYNWYAVNDPRGLAPVGYHIPSNAEWTTLINYLGTDAGGKMKEVGTSHWITPNTGATNSSGFTGLPGGYRYLSGTFRFSNPIYYGNWWSATIDDGGNASFFQLYYNSTNINLSYRPREDGIYVRLIKD
jgi:uncharacterized protein (TIGR02145 family)